MASTSQEQTANVNTIMKREKHYCLAIETHKVLLHIVLGPVPSNNFFTSDKIQEEWGYLLQEERG